MGEQDQPDFPKYYYSKDEQQNRVKDSATGEDLCGARLFQSQQELDDAGGASVWKKTPQELQGGQQQAQSSHMAGQQSPQTGQQDLPHQEQPPGSQPPDEAPSSTTRRR